MTGADFLSPRASILHEAEELICGDRNNSYGPPTQDFSRTAGVLNALGYRSPSGDIRPHDVAIFVAAVKLSRLMWSAGKRDNWTDLAGYAACGHECVVMEERNTRNGTTEEGCICPECEAGRA